MRQVLELLVARNEVALAIELEQHAQLMVVMDVGRDDALARGTGGFGAGLRDAFQPQPVLGFLDVAIGCLEGALGIYHARAGGVAERFHLVSGYGHGYFSSSRASSSYNSASSIFGIPANPFSSSTSSSPAPNSNSVTGTSGAAVSSSGLIS